MVSRLERRCRPERETWFVELGRQLYDVRAGQCWWLAKPKWFDEFLARRFPVEAGGLLPHVDPRAPASAGQKGGKRNGMDERAGVGESREQGWARVRLCNLVA